MVCEYFQGLLAPRCGARDSFPIPSMVEEIVYCLGTAKGRCPHYRLAAAEGRVPPGYGDPRHGMDEPLAP